MPFEKPHHMSVWSSLMIAVRHALNTETSRPYSQMKLNRFLVLQCLPYYSGDMNWKSSILPPMQQINKAVVLHQAMTASLNEKTNPSCTILQNLTKPVQAFNNHLL